MKARDEAGVYVLRAVEALTDDHVSAWAAGKGHPHGLTLAAVDDAADWLDRAAAALMDADADVVEVPA